MLGTSLMPSKCIEMTASGDVRMVGQCCLVDEFLEKTKGSNEHQYLSSIGPHFKTTYVFFQISFFHKARGTLKFYFVEVSTLGVKFDAVCAN